MFTIAKIGLWLGRALMVGVAFAISAFLTRGANAVFMRAVKIVLTK